MTGSFELKSVLHMPLVFLWIIRNVKNIEDEAGKNVYLHLGQDTVVRTQEIVGVFDLDNTTVSKHTKEYLKRKQAENCVVNVTTELPKSFIVCRHADAEIIYISQLSAATLLRRLLSRGRFA